MGFTKTLIDSDISEEDKVMIRVAKSEGRGNVVLEDVPMPEFGSRDVLIKAKTSLISTGSELGGRYMNEQKVDPRFMGYSLAGTIVDGGDQALSRFRPGERVIATAPHAEYVVVSIDHPRDWFSVSPIPDEISFEQAAFLPLCLGAVWWAYISEIRPADTVVVLGQGLVGNLVMQAARQYLMERLIAIDALETRCRLAADLGADLVINVSKEDSVEIVRQVTNGKGANVVIDCVGGPAGVSSFSQAQAMVCEGGTIHLIGLYQNSPLLLDPEKIQRKRVIGGYYSNESSIVMLARAIEQVQSGLIQVEPLVTHRFHFEETKQAYDLLYECPAEALGVLLDWD